VEAAIRTPSINKQLKDPIFVFPRSSHPPNVKCQDLNYSDSCMETSNTTSVAGSWAPSIKDARKSNVSNVTVATAVGNDAVRSLSFDLRASFIDGA